MHMEEKSELLGDDQAAAMEKAASSPALPASLLRYVAQACAGCLLRMCGARDAAPSGADLAPDARADDQAAANGGGETSGSTAYIQEDLQIDSRLLQVKINAVGDPREGSAAHGGSYN